LNEEVVVIESPSSTHEESAARSASTQAKTYPGAPRWVKLGAIVAVVVVVLVLVIVIVSGGEHGPVRHMPSAADTITIGSVVASL
jgi:hypothetical protein